MARLDPAIRRLRNGGWLPEISRKLKINRTAPYQWREVPLDRVVAVARITGIPPHELRPDHYPKKMFKVE